MDDSINFRVDSYPSEILNCFDNVIENILSGLPQSITSRSVLRLFYQYSKLILPVSYFPHLTISPVIYYNALMNLRYLSGLGDLLFTRLVEMIDSYKHPVLSQRDYCHLIESIYANKPLDLENVNEIFMRIYSCGQTLGKNYLGIYSDTLVFMLSAFYPYNKAVGLQVIKRWNEPISWKMVKHFLECVYCVLNEFFYCFDTTVVTLEQIAINVATYCFKSFHLSTQDQLSADQFLKWMKNKGPFVISKDNTQVSHYPRSFSREWKVDYQSLCVEVSPQILQGRQMYDPIDTSQADLQMFDFHMLLIFSCLDALVSFAAEMNICNCNDEIAECITRQVDPDGTVARSSFVSSVCKIMLECYTKNVNEERELLLEQTVSIPSGGEDDMRVRKGLTQVFDSLDVTATHLVNSCQLVAVLSLLSDGDIDSRLRYMIVESTPQIGDITYLNNIIPIVNAFFLSIIFYQAFFILDMYPCFD